MALALFFVIRTFLVQTYVITSGSMERTLLVGDMLVVNRLAIGSRIPGFTRNPYATNRVPAGSSGGTAAAVAASFGTVGLGTDTGNSIRGPSSHNALVGIRSTMGLTSRDGIVPLNFANDIGGPLARPVADAVAVFAELGYGPEGSGDDRRFVRCRRPRPTPDDGRLARQRRRPGATADSPFAKLRELRQPE